MQIDHREKPAARSRIRFSVAAAGTTLHNTHATHHCPAKSGSPISLADNELENISTKVKYICKLASTLLRRHNYQPYLRVQPVADSQLKN